ncbi:MAG: prolipoprotein diacylglyceryl transferase [Bacteroidetes bacterium]|nr:MAG: prolipoprotein diacylglyceryl transferase [Bacteroidota bacterium]
MTILQITWEASPVIFSLGPLSVRWYGLFWALSFYLGYEIVSRIFKKENVGQQEIDSLLIHIALGSVIGARLGHCFFYDFDYYISNPIEILFIWQGGLASHGGAFGIIIAVFRYYRKVSSKPFLWTADRLLIVIALGAMFIRLGNLMNHEIYGYVTDQPWGFKFIQNINQWMQGAEPVFTPPVHPTAIYEGAGYLFIFLSMMWLYFRQINRLFEGFMTGYFLITLFVWRFVVEYWKEPQESMTGGFVYDVMGFFGINMGQLLSVPMILLGIAVLVYSFKSRRPAIENAASGKK